MDYIIAISSYRRSKICNAKTLTTLKHLAIPKQLINIFIVDDDLSAYQQDCDPQLYNQLIVGIKGLPQQRQFISDFYPENTRIISLDDDIESLDLSLTSFKNADDFFNFAFSECERLHSYIWSIYPVYNPYFRKRVQFMTTYLSYMCGAFYGYINRRDEDLKLTITFDGGNKEDFERSILYYLKDRITLRFNFVGFETKNYGTDGGGLGCLKARFEMMKTNSIAIHQKYPHLTRIKIRKNGLYEVTLPRHLTTQTPVSTSLSSYSDQTSTL